MKRLLLCFLLLCSLGAMAQDVIVKKDGTRIECRVTDVKKDKVAYVDKEGLKRTMPLALVASINYENGETLELDEEAAPAPAASTTPTASAVTNQQAVSDTELLRMMGESSTTEKMLAKSKRLKLYAWGIGMPTYLCGVGLIISSFFATDGDDTFEPVLLYSGAAFAAAGGVTFSYCFMKARKLKKQASQLSVSSTPLFQQEFRLKNGATLAPSLDIVKDNTNRNTTLGLGLTYNF